MAKPAPAPDPIELTQRQFAAFSRLRQAGGNPVSRADMIASVYGRTAPEPSESDIASIKCLVAATRKRIGHDSIVTVPTKGWLLPRPVLRLKVKMVERRGRLPRRRP